MRGEDGATDTGPGTDGGGNVAAPPGLHGAALAPAPAPGDMFAEAFHANPDPMTITTLDEGLFLDVNRRFLDLSGFSRDDLLGRRATEIGIYADPAVRADLVRRLGEDGRIAGMELAIRNRTGRELTVVVWIERLEVDGRPCLLAVVHDATERKLREEHLSRLAYQDPLTGLPNRTLFFDRLGIALARARRARSAVAVVMLDLDRFKEINDTLGHPAGDRLLEAVGARLAACLRQSDTVARLGGDEFAIVLPDLADYRGATSVAQRILGRFVAPAAVDGRELAVTPSIGIAMFPADGADADALLKNADVALYRAKADGGATFRYFQPEMSAAAVKRLSLERDLRRAIERDEFLLHYQPQVEAETGRIVGLEALVRWRHPERGMVSPADFIPLAEETGLIVPLGEQVLRTACAQERQWREQGLPPVRLAVNLSARQIRDPSLLPAVRALLRSTVELSGRLELEITESFLMDDFERGAAILRELREMGARIALDDFGTGYSSLTYLHKLQVDTIKIGQTFVRDLASQPGAAAIVAAVVDLARGLGIHAVVAEGVETHAQLDLVRSLDCGLIQGYLFSRPLPVDAVADVLHKGRCEV